MAPRLKVFVTSDGLTDYVVAASSRAKALAAWGVRQDVFKEGAAHETDDPALVKAATAQPGAVLRKPAGTRGELAKLKPEKPAKPSGPTRAQLKKVDDLEARLAELGASHERAMGAIETERAALEGKRQALEERHAAQREKLEAALRTARAAPG
ncbi:MAG: hypothetical protein JWP28_538 [Phenylobacterium sp.]|uniref:hypothetical protein n=1 Tax=Phenylobacterium sp. TaxID=1871053 RepID=UPI00261A811C|nr:hypothetical protein [Phenylobacterium sp.]MDB5496507.1 hypothetical protein [Phenylobacterium sp.]